jgi:hypothetical protein
MPNAKKAMSPITPERAPEPGRTAVVPAKVRKLFKHCGYLRTPPDSAPNGHDRTGGHRGYEVRFMAHSRDECQKIIRMLKACRIDPGKPFNKGQQWRVPVYGRRLFVALQEEQ